MGRMHNQLLVLLSCHLLSIMTFLAIFWESTTHRVFLPSLWNMHFGLGCFVLRFMLECGVGMVILLYYPVSGIALSAGMYTVKCAVFIHGSMMTIVKIFVMLTDMRFNLQYSFGYY